jgi:predicted enzyme related to lactoylglutathione lyase
MLKGICTVTVFADDVAAAQRWYSEVFGIEAYFERLPHYVEFRVGDQQHEFGIIDRRFAPSPSSGPGGAIVYWHVDDVEAARERLLKQGASEYEPVTERGPGFVTASVVDPFGNVLGVMYNQHYLDVLAG